MWRLVTNAKKWVEIQYNYIKSEAVEDFVGDLLRKTAPDYVKSVWVHWKHYKREEWSDYM